MTPGGSVVAALKACVLAIALAIAAPTAGAADALDKLTLGPKVGETIPHTLATTDQTGKAQSFDTLKSGRGLVILFNRSVDW